MRRPAIAAAVRRVDIEVATVDGGRTFRAANRNALIGRYDGAIGVKSGYTAKAGKCVIALAERHGVRVWLVMLGGRDRWWDAHAMLDRAFAHLGAGQRASN
jgi:D-alanyl-D-alanine carboxypeptidase